MDLNIRSEINPLRLVLTHRPGNEHEYITPENLIEDDSNYLLFDDIIYVPKAIEEHKLFSLISLIEGSSIESSTFEKVKELTSDTDKVIVILDSAHDYNHVKKEIEIYCSLVSVGSYIVVTDGSQEYLGSTPRAKNDYPGYVDTWQDNNPKKAAEDFVLENDYYELVEPLFPFNEGNIDFRVTHWPSAFIKKLS